MYVCCALYSPNASCVHGNLSVERSTQNSVLNFDNFSKSIANGMFVDMHNPNLLASKFGQWIKFRTISDDDDKMLR